MTRHPSLLLLLLLCLTGLASLSLSRADTAAAPAAKPVRILNAHLGELPGLINADKTGPFVDLVHAIDDLYPEVSIRITIYPLARAMAGVIAGTADFSLPAIRNLQDADLLPYRFSTRSFGKVTHVLYSNTDHLITPDMAYGIVPTKRDLLIEATPGFLPIPLQRSMSIEQSLRKLSRGRIDAFIWARGGGRPDAAPAQADQHSPGTPGRFRGCLHHRQGACRRRGGSLPRRGDRPARRLRQAGEIYSRLHRPYVEWQPHPEPLPAKDATKSP